MIAVDAAGVATVLPPRPCPRFLEALADVASVQASWAEAGAWLRLKRGELEALADAYPEVRAAYVDGRRQGIEELQAALAKAKTRAGRRKPQAAAVRAMKRAGLF